MAPISRTHTDQTRRDVLYVCGCGLVGVGLFPFLHARFVYHWDDSMGDDGADGMSELAADLFHASSSRAVSVLTGTAFDLVTCVIAAAFALLGVGVMFVSCLELPPHSTRVCFKTFGAPLAVLAAGSAVLVASFYSGGTSVDAAWRASAARSFGLEPDQTRDPTASKTHATTVSSDLMLSLEASRGAVVVTAALALGARLLVVLSCLALSVLVEMARWCTDGSRTACPHQ